MKLSSRSLSGLGLRLLLLELRFTIMSGADYFHVIYCTLAINYNLLISHHVRGTCLNFHLVSR